jgi:alkylation response protein AidB-like acyl-CoA dehydrogenase
MLMKQIRPSVAAHEIGFDDDAEAQILSGLRALRPLLQAEAAAAEALRSPTDKVVAALDELDVWAVAVPKRLGGRGISSTGLLRVSAEMAKGDPSVSWVSQIINGTTSVTTLASDELQEEIFGNGVPKISGVFNPPGTATPVEGGYRVSGKWPYCSGFRQSAWGQWGVKIVHADGSVVPGNFCYVPSSEMHIEDTWYVPGLQGTGSDTAVAEHVFVPEHRMVHAARSYNYVAPGKKHHGAPSDYFPPLTMVHRTSAGVLLGAAEGLYEVVSEAAKVRPVVATSFTRQIDSQVAVRDLGEAATKLLTARMLLESATREMDAAALQRRPLTMPERCRSKAQGCFAAQIMTEAVESLMFIAGSSAFNYSNTASRYWRDFNVGARHFAYAPNIGFEVYGRSLLGVEPNLMPAHMV